MKLEGLFQGKNSVLYGSESESVLYEKLSNTIHTGKKERLKGLQKRIEEVKYKPIFETNSLKQKKDEKIENLVFNVTESCNFNCKYCIYSGNYIGEKEHNSSKMDFDVAKRAIDLSINKTKNPLLLSFYGGEPLNNVGLIKEIIKYVKGNYPNKIYAFSMTSNFYNADRYLEDIVNNEIHINISLDGPKKIHDKNRKLKGGKPTYNKIMKNLKEFEKIAPGYAKKHFRYNVTYSNQNDLPEIIKFFQENKQFNSARISRIESKGLKKEVLKTEVDSTNYKYAFSLISDYINAIFLQKDPGILRGFFDRNLKKLVFKSKEIMPKKLMLDGCCYPGNRKLFVDTEGTFYMCERFGKRLPIGNVKEGINPGLIDNAIERFSNIRNNLCTNCWAQRVCTPCIQSAKDPQKDISEKGLFETCNSNKSQILVALIQYTHLLKDKKTLENYINNINP